ncbi:AbrB/MazE/SpoVT family DNA-binding domain-containing protein [Calothrix sp. CCY 0018]|uniref:AbrB/MazE/SpoVT family DNA-binding domain-containing protein n=1 Tax=Calothrix sp. CCY 0018 TaxID=3103864 RepID=UPI0039C69116
MKIKSQIRKWGNSLGLIVPSSIVNDLKLEADTNILVSLEGDRLIIEQDKTLPTLDEILDSIPEDYRHPEDLQDFLESEPQGRELM